MALDEVVRRKLLEDHASAQRATHHLLVEGRNGLVEREAYLIPVVKIERKNLPLYDQRGEFRYYSRIREALERALFYGEIPKHLRLPEKTPEYVTVLVKR